MSDGLPSSLTVLRPIGFGTTMKGPSGQDVAIHLPNEAVPSSLSVSSPTPKTPKKADFELKSLPPAAQVAITIPEDEDEHHQPQHHDDVEGIDIGVDDMKDSDDDAEGDGIGFSAAELAGRATGGRNKDSYAHRVGGRTDHISREVLEAHAKEHGEEEKHDHHHLHHDPDHDHEHHHEHHLEHEHHDHDHHNSASHLPLTGNAPLFDGEVPNTTIAPDSRKKMYTFDELKTSLRTQMLLLRIFAVSICGMGIAAIVVSVFTLPTGFLHSDFSYMSLVCGIFLVLYSFISDYLNQQFQAKLFKYNYLCSFSLFIFGLIIGILSQTRTNDINGDVQSNWFGNVYSDDRKADFNRDYTYLESQAKQHLVNLAIIDILSAALLVLNAFLIVHVHHEIKTHLRLTSIETRSKAESAKHISKREQEVAAYREAVKKDPNLALALEQERLPAEVKLKLKAEKSAAKYATGLESTKSKKKVHSTPKNGGGDGKTPMAKSPKPPKEGGHTPKPPKEGQTPKAPKEGTTPKPTKEKDVDAVQEVHAKAKKVKRTPAEKEERKRRKKERKELEAQQKAATNSGELGPNVIQIEPAPARELDSDSDEDKILDEAISADKLTNVNV